ncbi:hypothetical protein Bca101_055999 [Brassica carinata]
MEFRSTSSAHGRRCDKPSRIEVEKREKKLRLIWEREVWILRLENKEVELADHLEVSEDEGDAPKMMDALCNRFIWIKLKTRHDWKHLANAEAVKKQAQDEFHHNTKPNPLAGVEGSASEAEVIDRNEIPGDVEKETDVFEVPVEQEDSRSGNEEAERLLAKEAEIKMLKARLYDMEKEHDSLGKENESLKSQLSDSVSDMSNVKANEDEMASKVRFKPADVAADVLSGESEMNGREPSGSADKCSAVGSGKSSRNVKRDGELMKVNILLLHAKVTVIQATVNVHHRLNTLVQRL